LAYLIGEAPKIPELKELGIMGYEILGVYTLEEFKAQLK